MSRPFFSTADDTDPRMALWTPPPPPDPADAKNAVENAVNDAVDEAGNVVDAVVEVVTDAAQEGGPAGGPPPALDPSEPIVELYNAVETLVDRASQITNWIATDVDLIATGVDNAVGTVAAGVENTLSRLIPIVIGFVADSLGRGGIETKISSLIDRLASKVDHIIAVTVGHFFSVATNTNGGKTDSGFPPSSDAGNGLRELARAVTRDAAWRKKHLKRAAYQLAAKRRPRIAKRTPGGRSSDAASTSSNGDAAVAQRMLARLGTLDEKLRRLEVQLVIRAPKSVAERAAFARCRLSLGTMVQQGGVRLASKATLAKASIAPGLIKGKR